MLIQRHYRRLPQRSLFVSAQFPHLPVSLGDNNGHHIAAVCTDGLNAKELKYHPGALGTAGINEQSSSISYISLP